MKEIARPSQLNSMVRALKHRGRKIGFVPTMGALHEGHRALVLRANKENDVTVVSIFVNPTQFGPQEDFSRYPRPVGKDRKLLRKWKVDFLFCPEVRDLYPFESFRALIDVGDIGHILCGKFRPGHFNGVATVVAKLFNAVQPDHVYFGAKDYQQGVVIQNLIHDFQFPLTFHLVPTVRESDGLALSSRNIYLNPVQRRRALVLPLTLRWARDQIRSGRKDLARIKTEAVKKLRPAVDRIDYLDIVDSVSLDSLKRSQPKMVVLAACFVGKTRLIDNVIIAP